jgi:hypothetical protein
VCCFATVDDLSIEIMDRGPGGTSPDLETNSWEIAAKIAISIPNYGHLMGSTLW